MGQAGRGYCGGGTLREPGLYPDQECSNHGNNGGGARPDEGSPGPKVTKDFWLVAQGGAGGQFLWWWASGAGVWERGVEGVEEPCCLLLLWWHIAV